MALHRSKLGPVGGSGGGETGDGGVVVDLDPLSAFALMGQRTEDPSTSTPGGAAGGTARSGLGSGSGGGGGVGGRRESQTPSPPASVQPPAGMTGMAGMGSWHAIELNLPAPTSRPPVQMTGPTRATAHGYPVAEAVAVAHPITPSNRRPVQRLTSSLATPSPPRQLGALGENSQPNGYKAIGVSRGESPVFDNAPMLASKSPEPQFQEKVDPLQLVKNEGIECLQGELLLVKLQNASCEGLHGKMVPGLLVMTTYKLVVIPHPPMAKNGVNSSSTGVMTSISADDRYKPFGHLPKEYVQVPMTCIDKIERDSDRKGAPRVDRYYSADVVATIHCKDARRLRVSFGGNNESERAMNMLQQLAFPGQEMKGLFAFSHRTVGAGVPDPGWHIYDADKEFDRMGVLKPRWNNVASPWRATHLNSNYMLCESYPSVLIVPASVTDDEVRAVALFRSEHRVPVLCWGRQADSASIWRSSQPKIGISRAVCAEDELMLASVAASAPARVLPIVDCRPRSSATANFAAGYGYESYPDCPLEFSGIGNIHVMRESLAKLENLCLGGTAKDQDWMSAVEDTRWLSHVRSVLSAAWTVAFKAHTQRTPVLVHCSHGWDRTSQVCSLAQMLLDPYYRTMHGFQVLIEKDWLAFGHPFHLRHAYGMPRGMTSGKEDQRSPIFLQFLDCTWQLVMQLPSYFEFNPRYLLCIADHIQTCRFGTLLCNTNKARRENQLETKCASLWTFLELHRPTFLSQLYQSTQEELLPPLSSVLRHVGLWNDYFLRWSPAPSFMPLPLPIRDESRADSTSTRTAGNMPPPAKPARLHGGGALAQQSSNPGIPLFRCEFDEMERWVSLNALDAHDSLRRAARGGGGDGDGDTSITQGQGSEGAGPQDLAAARKEIAELKAALEEKVSR
eukprot:g14490.t1